MVKIQNDFAFSLLISSIFRKKLVFYWGYTLLYRGVNNYFYVLILTLLYDVLVMRNLIVPFQMAQLQYSNFVPFRLAQSVRDNAIFLLNIYAFVETVAK